MLVESTVEEQFKNEANYRQLLVQGALAVLLPTEDLENACLRTLVGDVIAEPILGNSIGGKICEGWFVWSSITKLLHLVKAKIEPKAMGTEIEVDTRSRLEKFGLLSETQKAEKTGRKRRSTFSSIFWRVLQYGYLTIITVRFVIVGLFAAYSRPRRSKTILKHSRSVNASPTTSHFQEALRPVPMLSFKILPLISALVDLPHRMPWLSGTLALWQHHLVKGPLKMVGGTDGILDQ